MNTQQKSVFKAQHPVFGHLADFADVDSLQGRDLRSRLIAGLTEQHGLQGELRRALTGGLRKGELKPGSRVVHKKTGRAGKFVARDGNFVRVDFDGWQELLPFDAIEPFDAEGAVSSQATPGGSQGGYQGAPASQDKAATYFASREGQLALAKSIHKADAPPVRMGFAKGVRKAFKSGQRVFHDPTAKRGKYVGLVNGSHAGVMHDDDSIGKYPVDELEDEGFSPFIAPKVKVTKTPTGEILSLP